MEIYDTLRSRFFIASALLLAAAVLAGVWAAQLMNSMYDYRSPLHIKPPPAGEPLGHAVSQRLIIVLVDGLREDTSHDSELMPYLETLREKGSWAVMHSRPPSYSQPGYSTLLVGAWPDINDGPVMNLDYEKIRVLTQDNLFTAVHRQGGRTAIAAHKAFQELLAAPDVDDSYYTSQANKAGDDLIFKQVLEWLDGGGQNLMLVHFSQVDDAGDHLGGPNGEAWAEAATRVDGMIQMIGAKLDFTQDTLMIVSDHGQIDAGGHGGPEADNLTEPFILAGAGVVSGGYWGTVDMVDVAPTAAALLGAAIPASSQGGVQAHMLELAPEAAEALPGLEETQQRQLYTYYANTIGADAMLDEEQDNPVVMYEDGIERARENRLSNERMGRFFLLLVLLFATAFIIWKYRGRALLERIGLFAVYALAFTAVYVLAFTQTFTLSRVPSASAMILSILISSAAGFLAAWLVTVYWKKYFAEGLEAIAENTLALTGVFMAVLAVPLVVHFLINGTVARWTLPEMNTGFFALLSMIQIASLALIGGLVTGGSLLGKWAVMRRDAKEAGVEFRPLPARKPARSRSVSAKKRTRRGRGKSKSRKR
ncbi:MAG: alkaline phosphatase family protein [Anaerolineales bacterium]